MGFSMLFMENLPIKGVAIKNDFSDLTLKQPPGSQKWYNKAVNE